jgi:hypothetical protein
LKWATVVEDEELGGRRVRLRKRSALVLLRTTLSPPADRLLNT